MKSLDNICTPNDFGIYTVRANSLYNGSDLDHYALYPHNVRKKLAKYGGKLYVPFIYRGKAVILKGFRLYEH